MFATRQLSQTPPDKVNELFERLLATSDNVVKTCECLLADLKEELELLASLQEERLFRVLRRYRMQDLLRVAISDNGETSTPLAEVEFRPNNSGKMVELRRIVQGDIMDKLYKADLYT